MWIMWIVWIGTRTDTYCAQTEKYDLIAHKYEYEY